MTLTSLCLLFRPQAASPGQANGEGSLEVLATRFQVGRYLLLGAPHPEVVGAPHPEVMGAPPLLLSALLFQAPLSTELQEDTH